MPQRLNPRRPLLSWSDMLQRPNVGDVTTIAARIPSSSSSTETPSKIASFTPRSPAHTLALRRPLALPADFDLNNRKVGGGGVFSFSQPSNHPRKGQESLFLRPILPVPFSLDVRTRYRLDGDRPADDAVPTAGSFPIRRASSAFERRACIRRRSSVAMTSST